MGEGKVERADMKERVCEREEEGRRMKEREKDLNDMDTQPTNSLIICSLHTHNSRQTEVTTSCQTNDGFPTVFIHCITCTGKCCLRHYKGRRHINTHTQ